MSGPRTERAVLRNPFTFAFGLALTGVGGAAVVAVAVDPGADDSLWSRLVGCLVLASMTWFAWRVAGHPAVVLDRATVTVRQPFRRHTAPWSLVGSAQPHDGLRLAMAGAGAVEVWAFSSSVLAALSGNRSATRAASRIDSARPVSGSRSAAGTAVHRVDLGARQLLVVWCVAALVSIAGHVAAGAPGGAPYVPVAPAAPLRR